MVENDKNIREILVLKFLFEIIIGVSSFPEIYCYKQSSGYF